MNCRFCAYINDCTFKTSNSYNCEIEKLIEKDEENKTEYISKASIKEELLVYVIDNLYGNGYIEDVGCKKIINDILGNEFPNTFTETVHINSYIEFPFKIGETSINSVSELNAFNAGIKFGKGLVNK